MLLLLILYLELYVEFAFIYSVVSALVYLLYIKLIKVALKFLKLSCINYFLLLSVICSIFHLFLHACFSLVSVSVQFIVLVLKYNEITMQLPFAI